MARSGYNKKDGSKKGSKQSGQGRNRSNDCRHPNTGNKK